MDAGNARKALRSCRDYLGRLHDLGVGYPHKNHEVAAVALCSCLWAMATDEKIEAAEDEE